MKKRLLLFSMLSFIFLNSKAQEIVGYLPGYRDVSTSKIQYNKVTTIIYAFINPNTDGTLITSNIGNADWDFDMSKFLTVKSNCLSNGVKLSISVGGADAGNDRAARLNAVSGNSTYRTTLANALVNFATTHNLYGIDVDWEFPTTTTEKNNHEAFLLALRTAINASTNPNIKLGVAVGGEYTGSINHLNYFNNNAVQYVDNFHIMAYDFPASYNANHASLTDAQNSFNQWNSVKGVPKNKMLLGVPFYARDAARSNESEYNVFSTSNPATAYTSDLFSGWYYNGKTTLESKVDWVMAQGGKGIMIWDLGQDRTDAYSLLSAINSRMNTICPAPQPALGPDVGFCTGSVILNSNVATTAGRTFTWKKDGNVVVNASASANTYSTSAGGVFTVEVNQSGCSKSDVITVVSGSSLSANGDTRCGPGVVNLSVNAASGTYDWYNAATGGSIVHTGLTYSPTISNTTSYYVQQNTGAASYSGGRLVPLQVSPWAWNEAGQGSSGVGLTLPKWAHKITVSQDLTIQSVKIWTGNAAVNGVKLMVISTVDGTNILQQTSAVNYPTPGTQTITANLTLTPGTYYIGVYAAVPGGASPAAGIWLDHDMSAPTSQSGVFSIDGNCWLNTATGFNASVTPTAHYGQLYDWVITTGVMPPCGRTQVDANVTSAASTGLTVNAGAAVCTGTDGSVSIVGSENGVTYQPYKGVSVAGSASTGNGSTIAVTVNSSNLSAGSNTITIKATKTGCGTVDLTNTASITVNAIPAQPGSFTASTASVTQGQTGVVYTVPSVGGVSYQWTYSGTGITIVGGSTNSITASFSSSATGGTLSVAAVNTCGPSATTRDIVISVGTTAIAQPIELTSMMIYPNPMESSSVLDFSLATGAEVDIEIYHVLGYKVATLKKGELFGAGDHSVAIPDMPSGTYVVKLKIGNKEKNIKLLKN